MTQRSRGRSRSAEEVFDAIVRKDSSLADVTVGKMFGSTGFKVSGNVYAMLVKGRLVVKLPSSRIEDLLASGAATRFDPGHLRVMREWAAVGLNRVAEWHKLARDARGFVASAAGNAH